MEAGLLVPHQALTAHQQGGWLIHRGQGKFFEVAQAGSLGREANHPASFPRPLNKIPKPEHSQGLGVVQGGGAGEDQAAQNYPRFLGGWEGRCCSGAEAGRSPEAAATLAAEVHGARGGQQSHRMPVFWKNSLQGMLRYVPVPCLWGKKRKQSGLQRPQEGVRDTEARGLGPAREGAGGETCTHDSKF